MTRSRLGLLPVIFRKFVKELWHLFDVRNSFQLNIFRKENTEFNQTLYMH